MKRISIILTTLLMGTTLLSAQETKSNALGIHLGMGNLQKQDLIFSPFVGRDWSPLNVLLEYEHRGKIDQRASIRFGQYSDFIGESFSYYSRDIEYDKYPHSFTNLDLNYSLSKSVWQTSQWTISAGGRIRNRFQVSNFEFGHAGQFSYHLAIGLDALVEAEYRTGKHAVNLILTLPVISYLARSPYTGLDDHYLERIMVHGDLKIFWEHLKSGTIQSWGTSRMMDLEIGYNYALNSAWDIGITYLFSMTLHTSPVQYTSIENIFYIGTTFKF
jgi:hypothetical protein